MGRVEHLESALRLSLARRLGRVARWADWIELDPPLADDAAWLDAVHAAWTEADNSALPPDTRSFPTISETATPGTHARGPPISTAVPRPVGGPCRHAPWLWVPRRSLL